MRPRVPVPQAAAIKRAAAHPLWLPPPQPSEHRHRVSSASLQRGAGTELVVEMQDALERVAML